MGKRGFPPMTAAQLAARGSKRANARAAQEKANPPPPPPQAAELTPPPCPDFLTGEAATKWAEVVDVLVSMGVFTTADVDAVARYCSAWKAWREAELTLAKEGLTIRSDSGNVKQHPAVRIRAEMSSTLNALSDRLGLTPDARRNLNVNALFKRGTTQANPKPDPTPATQDTKPAPSTIDGESFFKPRVG